MNERHTNKIKAKPLVSIIVVNYNGKKYLKGCFASLLGLNYPKNKLEIIMVDNGSRDDSVQFVRDNFPRLKVLQNDTNNYCRANNLGISKSRGKYVALLNNDTKVTKNWLKELIKVAESDKSIGAVGSKILLPDGKIQNAGHVALPNFYWSERGFGEEKDKYAKLEGVTSLCGAAVLYRKKCFKEVGLFDEDFVMYMEDVDMTFRLKSSGWKIVFAPQSTVYHEFHGSANDEMSRAYIERNRLLFIAKHYPEKLSEALLGRGYFTVGQGLNYYGKTYQILPEVIVKIHKHHDIGKARNVLVELLNELSKISNYENNILIKEICSLKEQIEREQKLCQQAKAVLNQANLDLTKTQAELTQTKAELTQTKSEFTQAQVELAQTKTTLNQVNLDLTKTQAELTQTKADFTQTQAELLIKIQSLNQKNQELDSIYSSEGFRFILRPLWSLIWSAREIINKIGEGIKQFVEVSFIPLLFLTNIFVIFIFIFEYLLWQTLKILLKAKIISRSTMNFEDFKISIVIPNYNGESYLKECLPALFKTNELQSNINEVIVIDDASSDNSVDYVKSNFSQVNLICNNKNLGFGKSCNKGIKAAKNELIILLNSDTIVSEDFIPPLIKHFKDQEVFAVSPRLYSWDKQTFVTGMYMGDFKYGYVHIWNEKEMTSLPKIDKAAPTIFAIGCAACFRKNDFLSLGGFDKIFEPYSWEDIDISYRAIKRGLRVIYEPNSLVFHKVHGTIGSFKRSVEIKNELLFTWKNITDLEMIIQHFLFFPLYCFWKKEERHILLKGYLLALGSLSRTIVHRFLERIYSLYSDKEIFHKPLKFYNYSDEKNKFHQKKGDGLNTLLMITPFFPYPLKSGGQVKMYNSLQRLSKEYNIILLSFIENQGQEQYVSELDKLCTKVFTVLRRPSWNTIFNKVSLPVFIKYFYSKEMKEKLQLCLKDYDIDLVQIEYINMAYYAKFIPVIPKILVEHDTSIYTLANSYEKPVFGKIFQFFDWLNWSHFQKMIYSYFDKIITFTEEDCKIVQRAAPRNKISIIPIGIDLTKYEFSKDNKKTIDILFVGHMLHYPNIDGLNYFINKIFPLIKKEIPEVKFCVIGSCIEQTNLQIKNDTNIEVIGEVQDIRPYLSKTKVMVVPIRLGGGMKVKILEAMSAGVPVVAAKTAVKGLKVIAGQDIYVANSANDFADKVLSLIQDESKRKTIAQNSREVIKKYYDLNRIAYEEKSVYKNLLLNNNEIDKDQFMAIDQPAKDNKEPQLVDLVIVAGWDILLRCNYRCPYCFNNGRWEQLEAHNKPYTHEDWLNFWGRIYQKYGEISIIIAGGEPFVYHGLLDLIKKIVLLHRVEICTNLSVNIDKIIHEFSPQRLLLHPSFHPYRADLEEFIKKICALKQAGWDLRPVIVAYPPLLNKLEYFKKKFSDNGIGIFVQPFIGEYQDKKYPVGYTISEKELILSSINVDIIKYQLNSINTSGKLCKTGFKYFRVYPDGLIFRCATAERAMGSIEDKNFHLLDKAAPCELEFCICNNESVYLNDNNKDRDSA